MTTTLSYGGGRQTIALCVLVAQGKLPRPDWIVAADTGREAQSTWDYLDEVARPLMRSAGLEIHIAPHSLATVDMYGHNGDLLVPAHTTTGKLPTFCSVEWKQRVVHRFLRAQGVPRSEMWIGFSYDERHRIKSADDGPWPRTYPLVNLMLTRTDCETIITAAGLPIPHKSACYMCPHRDNSEWRLIRDHYPEQWQAAITLDQEIRDADERGGLWLHHSRTPLAEADIDAQDRGYEGRQCGLGMCWV